MDGGGGVTLAWARGATSISLAIETASAAPGQAFGAPSRVATSSYGEPALAVAPDGRALLAYEGDRTGVTVAGREPGAADFGPPVSLPGAGSFAPVAIALAGDGAAAVAWRPVELRTGNGVRVATRTPGGAFGAPRDAAPGRPRDNSGAWSFFGGTDGAPQDDARLAVAIAGASVVLAWADTGQAGNAAVGALAGGAIERATLGGPVRTAVSLAPLALPDGRAAVAWADDALAFGQLATGQGRLHVSLAGAPAAADAPAPALTLARLARQRLYADDPIVLPVRCAAACDVRASISGGRIPAIVVRSRASAGRLRLRIYGDRLVKRDTTARTVTLLVSAPGSHATASRRVRVPVRLRTPPPLPAPLGVRARLSGDDVIVTWHTAFPARRTTFLVDAGDQLETRAVAGRGRRSFRVTLHSAAKARRVTVQASGGSDQRPRGKTVRVR